MINAPDSVEDLLARAYSLAGTTLLSLANKHNIELPTTSLHAKGWIGKLLELELGADAGTLPEPDFKKLGIELKTIPLNKHLKPVESTYVCVVQLNPTDLRSWDHSLVKKKLSHVLWIPIESHPETPFASRRIGNGVLWQPDSIQERQLKMDWEELTELIILGNIDKISSRMGKYLQIRPKAANASSLIKDKNSVNDIQNTLPRGFYLRTSFTNKVINSHKS